MIEVAWAAVKKKGSYFKDKYYRLKARRGAKKAIVTIAHRILLGIYHVIKDDVEFRDLGEDCLTQRNKSQKVFHLRKQAQSFMETADIKITIQADHHSGMIHAEKKQ